MFACSSGNRSNKVSVNQLTGTMNESGDQMITKLRFAYINDYIYVEAYLRLDSNTSTRYEITSFGGLDVIKPIGRSDGSGSLSKEFIIQGNININN